MPKGANQSWRTFLDQAVDAVTDGADVVIHGGDQVEGRWYAYASGTPHVYGDRDTWAHKTRMVRRAGDTVYPWLKSFWRGHDVLWGMGDHEVGDIGFTYPTPTSHFKYKAFHHWKDVWWSHYGPSRHADRRGDVGIIVLDPFVKWKTGIRARVPSGDFPWIRETIEAWRADGVRWFIIETEVPARGPNREYGTSGLILENGDKLIAEAEDLGVQLILAAEFHTETTYATASGLHVVHGGRQEEVGWLVVDEYADRLELTMRRAVGTFLGSGEIWAPTKHRAVSRPAMGVPQVIGRATVAEDGTVTDRSGVLTEGL